METKDLVPLKWPEGWRRTLIDQRKRQGSWKRPTSFYRDQVLKELGRLGASAATLSYNEPSKERIDPGVAVWFSLKPTDDYSWQHALQIDSPMPTEGEIRDAFVRVARKHHPDQVANGSGGDTKLYLQLEEQRRKALAWIRGGASPALDNCIPCDRFVETRQNLAAIRMALAAFRQLERVGIPAILERVMDRAFKAALPAASEVQHVGK
jgi:hypothetical protein